MTYEETLNPVVAEDTPEEETPAKDDEKTEKDSGSEEV